MASGDVVYECSDFEKFEVYKSVGGQDPWQHVMELKKFRGGGPLFDVEVEIKGNVGLVAPSPVLESGKFYKITITEV